MDENKQTFIYGLLRDSQVIQFSMKESFYKISARTTFGTIC